MVSINRVTIIGNLGRDPERQQTSGGTPYAKFSVATNESYQDRNGTWQKSTEWHNIKVWGHSVDRVMQQLKKGSLVYIEGTLRSYELEGQGVQQMGGAGGRTRHWEIKALTWRSLDPRDPNSVGMNTNQGQYQTQGGFNSQGQYGNQGYNSQLSEGSYQQPQSSPPQNAWATSSAPSQNSWGSPGGSQPAAASSGGWGVPSSAHMGGSAQSAPQTSPLPSPQASGGSGGPGGGASDGDDPIPF